MKAIVKSDNALKLIPESILENNLLQAWQKKKPVLTDPVILHANNAGWSDGEIDLYQLCLTFGDK